MASKGKGPGGLGNHYPEEFLSPLNAPKPGKDHGPDVANAPLITPKDPLGYVPGGSKK